MEVDGRWSMVDGRWSMVDGIVNYCDDNDSGSILNNSGGRFDF